MSYVPENMLSLVCILNHFHPENNLLRRALLHSTTEQTKAQGDDAP